MKFIKAISIVILVISIINWGADTTVDLGGDGTQDMMLNYIDNPGSALMNIEFVAHLSNALDFYQTATAICFNKQDSADDIQEGDNGFGIMFACYMQDGCSDGTRLSAWLFASHLASMAPPTWAADGADFSQWNIGPHEAGNGTHIDTSFILDANDLLSLTIPPPSYDTNWRWYFNFLGNEPDTRLDQ